MKIEISIEVEDVFGQLNTVKKLNTIDDDVINSGVASELELVIEKTKEAILSLGYTEEMLREYFQ